MDEEMIAPCGMNCSLCIKQLALTNELKKQGFNRSYCPGCVRRGQHCLFMKDQCDLVGKGLVRFCFECVDFPCKRLKTLDQRYRSKYHMSMIANLRCIQAHGMQEFLHKEQEQWACPQCGGAICCHNGLCLHCDVEILRANKKYRWNEG